VVKGGEKMSHYRRERGEGYQVCCHSCGRKKRCATRGEGKKGYSVIRCPEEGRREKNPREEEKDRLKNRMDRKKNKAVRT